MTPLQRYLAEEIAVDHVDGLITRREALRRLALLGLSAAASTSLLAACAKRAAQTPSATPSETTPEASPTQTAAATEAIEFKGPEGRTLQGAFASTATARGSVLVIHENRGLTDHIRTVAGRLASSGYSALAIDLLSEEGGTASLGDSANATAAISKVSVDRFVADMKAGVDELLRRIPNKKVGAVGFCFGGGMVWELLNGGEARVAAAVPFYGPLPDGADFSKAKAAVLAIYAELDSRVNASREEAEAALKRAGLTHEIETFTGADHAFFNDTGPRYNAGAAHQAYARLLNWFGRYLG
jgi:carboxymethylenebutenolidase